MPFYESAVRSPPRLRSIRRSRTPHEVDGPRTVPDWDRSRRGAVCDRTTARARVVSRLAAEGRRDRLPVLVPALELAAGHGRIHPTVLHDTPLRPSRQASCG